jgi:hypothetical protein
MTHPYQTLVREITTPTLPAFVTSCLNLLSCKSSSKAQDVPISTTEVVFRSFATLLPRHTTIYRPFVSQIRAIVKPFVASTLSDGIFVPSSLAESARRLMVLSHLTAAKNAGGEEWGKAVRDLIKDIHVTADHIFRAVVEDWESTAEYVGDPVDVNAELSRDVKNADDLPRWTGIDAGVERMVGLLGLLEEYFKSETLMPISIPVGAIVDMVNRILSIAIPASSQSSSGQGSARLHPAIDGDEKAALWAAMPQIYVAALQIVSTVANRLQEGFLPMAQGILDQLAWVFPYGKHDSDFRLHTYRLTTHLLLQIGQSLSKSYSVKCSAIIRASCKDLIPVGPKSTNAGPDAEAGGKKTNGNASNANQNADTFLQQNMSIPQETWISNSDLTLAAQELLPLFLSHFPQNHLDISLRSLIERTSILSHNRKAMLSSIINPFVGKNGKAMTSILPHLTREFPNDEITEILLRPRMPLVPSTGACLFHEEFAAREDEDEDMKMDTDNFDIIDTPFDQGNTFNTGHSAHHEDVLLAQKPTNNHPGLGNALPAHSTMLAPHHGFGNASLSKQIEVPSHFLEPIDHKPVPSRPEANLTHSQMPQISREKISAARMEENLDDVEDSDDESVHLTMELDSDSEPEG